MWLIIGSTATYHWFPDARKPVDIDILTPAEIKSKNIKECFVDSAWHDAAEQVIAASNDKVFADPDVLLTLKVSHAQWDIHWAKTLYDVKFLSDKGGQVLQGLHDTLIPVWENMHGCKRVNMSKSMETFFDDAVDRQYDHEELHRLVAFYSRPMHEVLRPDHGTAWCSKERWDNLTREDKLKTALEEIMAVAIERYKLTAKSKASEIRIAVNKAHKQLCTTMTKGWFAQFLIQEHFCLLYQERSTWMTQISAALSKLPPPARTRSCRSSPTANTAA